MRLCVVKESMAIFHKWGERSEIVPPSPMIGGHGGGVLKYSTALVEYENGQVTEIIASDVVFCDTEEVIRHLILRDCEMCDYRRDEQCLI